MMKWLKEKRALILKKEIVTPLFLWGATLATYLFILLLPTLLFASLSVQRHSFNSLNIQSNQSNLSGNSSGLILISARYRFVENSNLSLPGSLNLASSSDSLNIAAASVRTDRPALVYPNPFRLEDNAYLGYGLSRDMAIEIIVYNSKGREVARKQYPSSTPGGMGSQYNRISLDSTFFNFSDPPAGVYFYLIVNDGTILSKGKMAIRP
tara:strand:- start:350 stop:976 length:627 start_codon:yes stop_codon:yes gene_type:complete